MDWVHCNQCYVQPGDVATKKFFITNCGHIYCGDCLELNPSNECRICHIKCNTMPLTSNMNPEVEIYFHDPVANIKKQVKILEFQQSHRIRLISYTREKIRSYKTLKKENYKLCEQLKLCKQENATLRGEVKRTREEFSEIKKKIEQLTNDNQTKISQGTPMRSFSQFMTKPVQGTPPQINSGTAYNRNILGLNSSQNIKRSTDSNFFLMSESKPLPKTNVIFTTPDSPKYHGSYRSVKTLTPDIETPSTPDIISREQNKKDPLERRVKLPGSRNGPSPATKIGLHRLMLGRATSTPIKENSINNKYLKYFK